MNTSSKRRVRSALVWLFAWVSCSFAHASIAVLVGEPFGNFGTMMPLGHTAIYLDHLCADGPLKVRVCRSDEQQGVVLARYHAIGTYDWLATPVMDFLYATQSPTEIPTYATAERIWKMRQRYRRRFLSEVIPDGMEGFGGKDGSARRARNLEEWWETAGMAYQRRFWVYQLPTTLQQDNKVAATMNADANHHRYHLNGANCADFAAELMNVAYPGSVTHADRVADYGLMTPKHVVRSLTNYVKHHEEVELHVWEIPQIPGTLRRSKTVWGGVEAALKTKRYVFTLLVIQPEIPLVLSGLYLNHGRWKMGDGAQLMPGWLPPPMVAASNEEDASRTSEGAQ